MKDFILMLCWLGVFQSVLLGAYFLSASKNKPNYFFLGFTLVMIGIRVTKSTIFLVNPDLHLLILNIGFAAHALLGPLFLLYIQTLTSKNVLKKYLLHAIPSAAIIILSPYLTLIEFWYRGGYSALLYYTLVYLVIGWYILIKDYSRARFGPGNIILLIIISIFQLSYFSNYILRLTPYEAGPVVHSIVVYAITFLVLKNNEIFTHNKRRKYENLNLSLEEITRYKQKLLATMKEKEPYLDSEFSLAKCSDLTGIPTYILSYVMSESLNQNFLHFINSYRIEKAKSVLVNPKQKHLSIASIAHDCGFNTLSSFNSAFKKFVGEPPSTYRRKMMNSNISYT